MTIHTLAPEPGSDPTHLLVLNGCDDHTIVALTLTGDQAVLIGDLAALVTATSGGHCQPVMELITPAAAHWDFFNDLRQLLHRPR